MNFTREPIVESIVTPREGCKLVVRNSKASGQEEYFVDAVEIVTFGSALFFRSLERPKSFLLPVSDYEILEVRETRMMLKAATVGERPKSKESAPKKEKEKEAEPKKKERRRRRRRKEDRETAETPAAEAIPPAEEAPLKEKKPAAKRTGNSLLPPPETLVSESIGRYKEMVQLQEEEPPPSEPSTEEPILPPPAEPSAEQVEETAQELGVFSATRFIKRLASEAEEEPSE